MIFNSAAFAVFLPVVFVLYWFVFTGKLKYQNILLLLASYFFYGWWDWRFLFLLFSLSMGNYSFGILMGRSKTDKEKKIWFRLGLLLNIGILCVFKYYNFFIDSFIDFISLSGYHISRSSTRIILPLGISFYVFLSLSYIIDVFKNNLRAEKNVVDILLSLGFFPIILAGPIQRPSALLPQIAQKRNFDYDEAADGLRQILWGLFAKVVIADNLSPVVDKIFIASSGLSGSKLALGVVMYAFQIYADFSGYSNIAIGTGKLLGFKLMQNFSFPYFSRDISEFWKKWHISLTTWFRDYVFLPVSMAVSWKISGEKISFIRTDLFIYIIASIVTWFLTGLWHGANYTFIVWGMIHGFFLIIHHIQKKPRKRYLLKLGVNNNHPAIVIIESFFTLIIVFVAWIFFRAESISTALDYITHTFTASLFAKPVLEGKTTVMLLMIMLFLLIEWFGRKHQHALFQLAQIKHTVLRWSFYFVLVIFIFIFSTQEQEFIYFQF